MLNLCQDTKKGLLLAKRIPIIEQANSIGLPHIVLLLSVIVHFAATIYWLWFREQSLLSLSLELSIAILGYQIQLHDVHYIVKSMKILGYRNSFSQVLYKSSGLFFRNVVFYVNIVKLEHALDDRGENDCVIHDVCMKRGSFKICNLPLTTSP